jgi:uncharacterized C2H2 Zn-finger protein
MTDYKCDKCDKSWKQKFNYVKHMDKNDCMPQIDEIKLQCDKLKKQNDKLTTNNHKLIEQNKKLEKQKLKNDKLIENLKKENEKLKTEYKSIKNLIRGNHNILNTGTINIMFPPMVPHGYEDYSIITNDDMLKICDYQFKMTDKIIEKMYFNPKHPENQNIFVKNFFKKKLGFVDATRKWSSTLTPVKIIELKNTIMEFIFKYRDILSTQIDENVFLDKDPDYLKTKKYAERVLNKIEVVLNRYYHTEKNNNEYYKKLIELLYNNKNITTDTIKKYKSLKDLPNDLPNDL